MNELSSYRIGIQAPSVISSIITVILVVIILLIVNPTFSAYAINFIMPIADVVSRVVMHFILIPKYTLLF